MNTYKDFVENYAMLMKEGKSIPYGSISPLNKTETSDASPKVLIFSPHPDDESIIAALPLRLRHEMNLCVINVPVTYGSNKERLKERQQELMHACNYLGFSILQIQEDGLQNVKKSVKLEQPTVWNSIVKKTASIINDKQPHIIFTPHDKEFNATHAGTHELVIDSLSKQMVDFNCYVIEWEYWTPLEHPNLLLEVSREQMVALITAMSFHVGEVKRNPQHVNLPAWMQDNVRRGSELIGAQGGKAPDFEFASIYQIRKWEKGNLFDVEENRFISSKDRISDMFPK